ncbi:hypothetical protein MMYC01_208196 [Madurella mycetomatis]|uniref:Uncharacterized protein n=1 Tax=Madurella mycetomatis TaxID=100816 RepID=A0A175VNW8_9PEZI|nr:hypothetical protein MMYC01_210252 [Madurella mycetomatis]KXX74713.1 hypothetical protein MMYC01_208196 [Madurella mycetomatis]
MDLITYEAATRRSISGLMFNLVPVVHSVASETWNSTFACMRPELLFRSFIDVANCITISAASFFLTDKIDVPLTSPEIKALHQYGVGDLASFNGTAVLKSIIQCAAASCHHSDLGPCSDGMRTLEATPSLGPENLDMVADELRNYCSNTLFRDMVINAGVAGPGRALNIWVYQVLLAHLMQTLLVLVVFCLLKLVNSWARGALFFLRDKEKGMGGRAVRWQKTITESALNTALLLTTVEIQEAQSFFALAIQIGTLVIFRHECGAACTSQASASSMSENE